MSKKKLEEGGLLQQEDVNNSSTVSSVPYEYSYLKSEDTNLNLSAPQSIIDSTIKSVGFAEQTTRAGFGAEMPTLEARPDAYKTVFKSDFSNTSQDIKITQINSNTITLESAIGFTPTSGDKIEKIGFQDGGTYYALV